MKLHEYQSKRIFAKYNVPIPEGDVATTPAEARQIAQRLGGPTIVKAQVLVGGRGKAGGIKVARDADEAETLADQILGMTIKGLTVEKVLIDQAADIREEIYLGITIDRTQRKPVMMASSEGGVEIEEVAKATPEKIFKLAIDPAMDLMDFQARNLGF
nr:succinate--CoA ligase subunit beta [Deltaproteobacteria bacterium]